LEEMVEVVSPELHAKLYDGTATDACCYTTYGIIAQSICDIKAHSRIGRS
jgi:hypothetical protein